jgi:argininosuccinate lyase
MLSNIEVRENILAGEKYKYLFSVEAVNELVNQGIPFREAYQQVGNSIDKGTFTFDFTKGLHHTHEGSIGHLSNAEIAALMKQVLLKFDVNQ